MDLIFQQLGDLVLGSVPTMILFLLLIAAYSALIRGPLDKILAERRARTTGAIEQAQGAIAAAEAETTVYEDKLRAARSEIFTMREQRLAQWQREREAVLGQVRESSSDRVRLAREAIQASAGEARAQIEAGSGDLAARVLAVILPARAAGREAVQ